MNQADTNPAPPAKEAKPTLPSRPLRVWPVILLLLVMLVSFIPSFVIYGSPAAQILMILGPAIAGVLMLVWWLLGSRASLYEKLLGMFGFGVAFGLTVALVDISMFGMPLIAVTIPMGGAALGLGAILFRKAQPPVRTVLIMTATLIGFGASTMLRGAGVWGGDGYVDLSWRFVPSAEDKLVANQPDASELKGLSEFDAEEVDQWLAEPEWAEFRGVNRAGVISGANLDIDWGTNPPKKVWSIPVGPGWSSFSVAGDLLFTQEQRGAEELVICYSAQTGEELWKYGVESRFEDSIGGPGPRATPTIAYGDLFVLGASGHLMRLDAKTGDVKWQTKLGEVTGLKPPRWGYAASPLVIDDQVIVHAGDTSAPDPRLMPGRILSFDIDSGDERWSVESGSHSYSSPEHWSIDDRSYIAMMTNAGFELVDLAKQEMAATDPWPELTYRALQPRLLDDQSVIVCSAQGMRRIKLNQTEDGVAFDKVWESRYLKADFNDYVVHDNHAYGFHNAIFSCVDLADGSLAWMGGRYGKGQVLLLADLNALLIISEKGELVLVNAIPERHEELASWSAIEGKTWNHPVLVGNRLYVRNSTEAACIELPTKGANVAAN